MSGILEYGLLGVILYHFGVYTVLFPIPSALTAFDSGTKYHTLLQEYVTHDLFHTISLYPAFLKTAHAP